MTNREIISALRKSISEYSDDSYFTDQYLYFILNNARKALLYKYLKNIKNKDLWSTKEYCVKLELGKAHDCDCVNFGCDVLKSTIELPREIGDNLKVYTLGYNRITEIYPEEQKHRLLHPIYKKQISFSLVNNKIVLWNNINLKAIIVKGIWEDPADWAGKTLCEKETLAETCTEDPRDLEFDLPANLHLDVLSVALKLIFPSLKLKEDETNNSNSIDQRR